MNITNNGFLTIAAYADCNMDSKQEAMSIRNLDFRDNVWLSIDDWEELMLTACPNGYNCFEADDVASALRNILKSGSTRIKIQAAREGSVACYIKGSQRILKKILDSDLHVDEASIENGELRLWWD